MMKVTLRERGGGGREGQRERGGRTRERGGRESGENERERAGGGGETREGGV